MFRSHTAILLTTSLLACGRTEVTAELKNVHAIDSGAARAAGDVNGALTIESLKVPVLDISIGLGEALLGGDGLAETVYVCPEGTQEGCMVELVGDALDNLLVDGDNVNPVPAGEYTSVMTATCWEEGSYTVQVQASGELDGQTWYTSSETNTLTTDETTYGPAEVVFQGCRNYSVLNTPVVIGEESAVTLNLYIDLRDIGAISNSDGPVSTAQDGCTDEPTDATDPFLCMSYANVIGNIGEVPNLERYMLEDPNDPEGARLLGLYFDSLSDEPIGGFSRDYYDDEHYGWPQVFSSFKRAYIEGEDLVVTDYEGAPNDTIGGNGDNTIIGFPRPEVGASVEGLLRTDAGGDVTGSVDVTRLD